MLLIWLLVLFVVAASIGGLIFYEIRRKKTKNKMRWYKIIGIVLISILLVPLVGYLVFFPPHSEIGTTGVYKFTSNTVQYETDLTDPYKNDGSKRKISVEYFYPKVDDGVAKTFPLVVFSHGGMGTKSSNVSLYRELASHGYVVATVDHTYQCLYTAIDGKLVLIDRNYMNDILSEDPKKDISRSYELYQEWMSLRTNDISFVIDYAKNHDYDFYGLVDDKEIAVMGHSLGGSAALAIGRMRDDVIAVIALESPFMYDIIGVENGEFVWNDSKYPVPVMNIYTDSSYDHLADWPQYKRNYELLSSDSVDVKNIYLKGTRHFSITDLALVSPILTRILDEQSTSLNAKETLRMINSHTLEFLDKIL